MNITKSIEEIIYLKKINLGEYATRTGIAQSSISTIKKKGVCSTKTLPALALDLPVSEFIKLGETE